MSMGEKVDFAARKEDREEERERKNSRSSTIFFTSCETRNSQEKIPTSRNRFSIRFEDVDLKHLEENFQSFSSLHTKSPELSQSQKGDGLGTKRTGAQIIRVYLDEEDTLIQKIGLPQSFSIKYTDDLRTPSLRFFFSLFFLFFFLFFSFFFLFFSLFFFSWPHLFTLIPLF